MRIDFLHIQNFRKLKNCRIDISIKETLLVGANIGNLKYRPSIFGC